MGIRSEASRQFRNKKREYLKEKINEPAKKTIRTRSQGRILRMC
jgi:hypothetical protein